jgi:hypothetical protein
MKRRDFLTLSSIAAIYIVSGCAGGGNKKEKTKVINRSIPLSGIKTKSLPIPKLLYPTDRAGIKHYDLDV